MRVEMRRTKRKDTRRDTWLYLPKFSYDELKSIATFMNRLSVLQPTAAVDLPRLIEKSNIGDIESQLTRELNGFKKRQTLSLGLAKQFSELSKDEKLFLELSRQIRRVPEGQHLTEEFKEQTERLKTLTKQIPARRRAMITKLSDSMRQSESLAKVLPSQIDTQILGKCEEWAIGFLATQDVHWTPSGWADSLEGEEGKVKRRDSAEWQDLMKRRWTDAWQAVASVFVVKASSSEQRPRPNHEEQKKSIVCPLPPVVLPETAPLNKTPAHKNPQFMILSPSDLVLWLLARLLASRQVHALVRCSRCWFFDAHKKPNPRYKLCGECKEAENRERAARRYETKEVRYKSRAIQQIEQIERLKEKPVGLRLHRRMMLEEQGLKDGSIQRLSYPPSYTTIELNPIPKLCPTCEASGAKSRLVKARSMQARVFKGRKLVTETFYNVGHCRRCGQIVTQSTVN
jgi:hypothetical protein